MAEGEGEDSNGRNYRHNVDCVSECGGFSASRRRKVYGERFPAACVFVVKENRDEAALPYSVV